MFSGGGGHDFLNDDISFAVALVPFVVLAALVFASLLEKRIRVRDSVAETRPYSNNGITLVDVNAPWGPALSALRHDLSVVCRMEANALDHRSKSKEVALLGRRAMRLAIEAFRHCSNPQHGAWQDFIFTINELMRYHERMAPMCELPECVRLHAFVDENADAFDTTLESIAS